MGWPLGGCGAFFFGAGGAALAAAAGGAGLAMSGAGAGRSFTTGFAGGVFGTALVGVTAFGVTTIFFTGTTGFFATTFKELFGAFPVARVAVLLPEVALVVFFGTGATFL
ncbi:MAG: hypothetical protein IPK99_01750 [Flavobacteriales bacterium]|nr:hypothetical protein [Flavobacteriales bacterium]